MSTRPIIGIAPTHLPAVGDIRLAANYADAVIAAGGAPLILPLTAETDVYDRLLPLIDGILLTGGHDVDPARWRSPADAPGNPAAPAPETTPLRDEVEYRLIAHALAVGLPLFGICRGLQILNVYCGGTLYDDLPRDFSPVGGQALCEHDARTPAGDYDGERLAHRVELAPGSQLAQIFSATELMVNSLHHQAARTVAPGLRATAVAPDGVIEGLEAADGRSIVAVQWHPEYFGATEPMRRFFRALVEAAR